MHTYLLTFNIKHSLISGKQLLATASEDASVRVWNVDNSDVCCVKELRSTESLKKQSEEEEMLRCSWSQNVSGLLAGGNSLGSVIFWDTTKEETKDQVVGRWSSDGGGSEAKKSNTKADDLEQIYVCAFCPTKGVNEILVGGEDTLREVDVETMKTKQTWKCEAASNVSIGGDRNPEKRNYVFDSCFGFDGIVIGVATADGAVHLRDRRVNKVVASLLGHHKFATGCAFSFANRSLVSCSGDGTVSLWDCRTWKVRAGFQASSDSVYGCSFGSQISKAGSNSDVVFQEQIVTWASDGSVRWWEISDAVREIHSQILPNYPVYSCSLAPRNLDCRSTGTGMQRVACGGGGNVNAPICPGWLFELEWEVDDSSSSSCDVADARSSRKRLRENISREVGDENDTMECSDDEAVAV